MRTKLLFVLFLVPLAAHAAGTVDDVLSMMDQGAAKFIALSGELTRITYTKVIDDKATEMGSILLKKQGPRDLQVLINFATPDKKVVAFRGRKAEIYFPKMKTVQEYDLGKHSNMVDQFLLVGFGTTGKDLKANYTVKYAGEETISGQKTHKLDLTPVKADIKDKLRKLELWIAENGTYPVQQKFLQSSGDYYVFTYSAVKLNPQVTDEQMRLNLPKGVKRERMQK